MGVLETLQQLGGLGLSAVKGVVGPQGLGLANPPQQMGMFGAPAEYKPTDFSDLNPIGQIAARFQNAVASGEGRPLPSIAASQRRAQGNQKRMDAYKQGLDLLADFDGIRDKANPDDYDRIDAALKRRFAELAGGQPGEADTFYDTFMSGRGGQTAALLEMAKSDPGAQQLIAGGGGMGDLRRYFTAPDRLKMALDAADQKQMPEIGKIVSSILSTSDPKSIRAIEAKRKAAGGRLTLSSLRELQAEGSLPADLQLTDSQWQTAMRHESDFIKNGLTMPEQIVERRGKVEDSELKRQEDAARIAAETEKELAVQRLRNEGAKSRRFASDDKVFKYQWDAANYGHRLEQASEVLDDEAYDRASIEAGLTGMLPNFARSTEFQQYKQAELNFLHAVLRKESGAVINPDEYKAGEAQYFPRAGDSPETVEQKRANRRQVLENLRAEAGPAWGRAVKVPRGEKKKAPGRLEKGQPKPAATPEQIAVLEQLRAGKISREQARQMLKAMGAGNAQ